MIPININLRGLLLLLSIISVLGSGQTFAASSFNGCYDVPGLTAPQPATNKALYVLIDQTMTLTTSMKQAIVDLVSQWGKHGERVAISRFSANIKGQYTELMFDGTGTIKPDEAYLYQLRRKDKKALLECLDKHKNDFHDAMVKALNNTLKLSDSKLPKTNILQSLNNLATQLVANDSIRDKTVLLISDGLENSDVFSFHYRHKIKLINPKMMLDVVRHKQLIANWHGAKIYMLGLGFINDKSFYARPKIIEPLKKFWVNYFTEGNGTIEANSIGTPMLLTKSILP